MSSVRTRAVVAVPAPYPNGDERPATSVLQEVIEDAGDAYSVDNVARTLRLSGHYFAPATRGTSPALGPAGNTSRQVALSMRSGVRLVADRDAVLYAPYGSSGVDDGGGVIFSESLVFAGNGVEDWGIDGVIFASDAEADATERPCSCIAIGASSRFFVRNSAFRDTPGQGVLILGSAGAGAEEFNIDDNDFRRLSGQAVTMAADPALPLRDFSVSRNRARDAHSGAECIALADRSAADGRFESNDIVGWGPLTVGGDRLSIIGNKVRGAVVNGTLRGAGIGYHGGADSVIIGNLADVSLQNVASGAAGENAFSANDDLVERLHSAHNTWTGGRACIWLHLADSTDMQWHNDTIVSADPDADTEFNVFGLALDEPNVRDIKVIGPGPKTVRFNGATDGGLWDGIEVRGGTVAWGTNPRLGDLNHIVAPA